MTLSENKVMENFDSINWIFDAIINSANKGKLHILLRKIIQEKNI